MKILYYSPHPELRSTDPSGYGTHIREMMTALSELGHEVIPFIIGDTYRKETQTLHASSVAIKKWIRKIIPDKIWVTLRELMIIRKDAEFKSALLKKISETKPDLVYERAAFLQTSGVDSAREQGVRHILEINAPLLEESRVFFGSSFIIGISKKREEHLVNSTSKISTVSTTLKKYLIAKYNLPEEKIVVIPNAVRSDFMSINRSHADLLLEKYNGDKSLVIGFVGSIFPWHGVDILVKAFLLIADKLNVKLILVGDGVGVEELKKSVDKSTCKDRIFFTGNVPVAEVKDYISLFDIAVMADSNWYGSPVKLFEYGISGKAIIAPDTKPVREVMINGIDGLLISPHVEELVGALETLIYSEQLRTRYGSSFREKVLSRHTWNINAKRILEGVI